LQPTQSFGITTATLDDAKPSTAKLSFRASITIASNGQMSTHHVQPVQFSSVTTAFRMSLAFTRTTRSPSLSTMES
jgi:hypothetical protein